MIFYRVVHQGKVSIWHQQYEISQSLIMLPLPNSDGTLRPQGRASRPYPSQAI
jgi:hypothetical protein